MRLYQSLADRLKNQHEAIGKIIANANSNRLDFHPQSNKWSIKDNIVHLAKYQPIFIERIKKILNEDSPAFGRYVADDDPEFESWRQRDIPALLKTLNSDRQILFDLIVNLNGQQLQRTGIHKKFGKLTLEQWIEFFLLHEAHHLFTIFQIANDAEITASGT